MKTIGKYEIIEEPTDEILEEEILEDNVLGSDKNPYIIDEVTVRPYGFLVDRKHNMDYYLDPSIYNKRINIARALNSGYIDQSQIFGWNPSNMKYNPDLYGDKKNFRKTKRIARHNKHALNKAMKYAGSDQQSAADKKFYKDLGITFAAVEAGIPAAFGASAVLAGAIATAPKWIPWVATNVVLPALGGAVVDDVTRGISGNYYNSFGDFVYRGSGLNQLTDGTWAETPAKFLADMTNPGYWSPYSKTSKYAPKVGEFFSKHNPWPTIYETYKNIGVVKPIKDIGKVVDDIKTIRVQSPVYVTEEVVAPVTSSGVVQTPERFVSSWGWRSPIYRKPKPAPAPAPTPTPNPVPPVGATTKVEGAGYTFRRPVREMTKRGVKVDPKYNRELRKSLRNENQEFIDAFAAEARKYYDETGEMVSSVNAPILRGRANERLWKMRNLRNDIHHGDYVDASGVTQTYTREQLDNFAKELKNHVTEMSYFDPNAQRLNWFSHPITNIFSPKPTAWAANHPIWSRIEGLWPLWGAASSTVWGRDWWSEDFPNFLKSLYVRPEESKPVETPIEEEPSEFDRPIDGADTLHVSKQDEILQRGNRINPNRKGE